MTTASAPQVIALASQRGVTVSTAESLTGGWVASALVGVPGASEVFRGGIVAYVEATKESLLGVPAALLAEHGPVSAETARAMATGGRERTGADLCVATTGAAGPDAHGGQPAGTVWIAVARADAVAAVCAHLAGDRDEVREAAVARALGGLGAAMGSPEDWRAWTAGTELG